ncbi:TrbI/VirB10 family protein [Labrenzia sp. THAF82]|uniref:TrbI/VirB10 family protein n=1 Tax=Labrenzia sp. THAF82 TaxID=2587861 RepID=UPI001267945B|nr:TrbI/VirB10 family protein [Labrenzia sp. THAF82]
MRLRAEPPKVVRLSRRALIVTGVVASLALGGVVIYGLLPPSTETSQDELFSIDNRPTADGLANLPRDYSGPILGPPLPGDLGRPILKAQARGEPVAPPVIASPGSDPEAQRRLAEAEAARTSQVFFQTRQNAQTRPANGRAPEINSQGLFGQRAEIAPRNPDRDFLLAAADRRTVAHDRVVPPVSPYVLQAGSVIPAALITGIRSDLPGQISAQVTQHIYDSPSGEILLVPQGTRVIGEYSNNVGFGQRRILLVWTRLIFPNGRSIVLERLPGADLQGYAGLEGGVDNHWWDLAKAAGLSTLLSIGAELAARDDDQLIEAIRSGAQDTITEAGQDIIERQLQVAPTLTIRTGFPVRVIVTRDLILEPYRG